MSVRFLYKRVGRQIIIVVGTLLLGILLVIAGMQFVLLKINQNREVMATKLKQELGLPLTFNTIEARWFGLSLGISVKDVVVFDPKVPTAFLEIENIALFPDISSLLFKSELHLKKMVLRNLKLMLGWGDKNDLSILGLQGELLPTSIDYKELMTLFSKLHTIILDGAKIEWRGPHIQINQSLRGKFDWVQTKTTDWKFVGVQQLQIRDGLNLPESDFNLMVSPNLKEITLKLVGSGVFAQCNLQLSEDKKRQVDCFGEVNQFNLAEIHPYYHPIKTDLPLLQWLAAALTKGKITEARVGVTGSFDALKGFGEVHFKGTDLQYASDWPKIEKARGLVTIESDRVLVKISKGSIMGSPIQSALAQISPIGDVKTPVVMVEGVLDSTLENGLLFLQKSPLQTSIAQHLEMLNPKGLMHLNVKFAIPLDTQPVKVDGSVLVKNGQFDIPDWHLGLNQLNGTFQFSDSALNAENVRAELGHLPLTLNVRMATIAKQKNLEIMAQSTLSAAFLQQEFPSPFLQKLHGQSLFTLLLNKPLDSSVASKAGGLKKPDLTSWTLSSGLEGMKIDLPSFFGKKPDEQVPMTLKIGSEIKGERKIALQLLKRLDAKLVTTGSLDHLSIKNGHIVLGSGNADWTTKQGLFLDGEVEKFKADEWSSFFDEIKVKDQKTFPPLHVHLLIDQLEMYGLRFNKTWVSVNFADTPLKWQLDGPYIKGRFSISALTEKENTKKIEINLAYLKIMALNPALETKNLTQFSSFFSKNAIHFYCGDLQYNQGNFGAVSFKLIPAAYGYRIQDLLAETSLSELSGDGEWHLGREGVYTTLQGKLTSVNMGKTLSRWDFPTAIRESSGLIQYQFRWPKHPFQFKLGIVDGNAELKFDKGRILGVNPGLGRIMGLLNLENIYRRLQLDFSDLVKKGFVFDTLKGKFQFQNGVANTDKLSIDGPSAKITLAGKANMNTKAVDLEMAVAPHVESGIPLAAAIAVGNPAVGAGLWIIDKLTGSKINKMTRHRYHVTGTWDSPSIVEATNNSERSKR